jgi:hypothetical protein
MQIDERDEHSENAEVAIERSSEPDSKVTSDKFSHRSKQLSPRSSTNEGMQMDEMDEQSQKPQPPSDQRLEPDSKSTIDSFSQE